MMSLSKRIEAVERRLEAINPGKGEDGDPIGRFQYVVTKESFDLYCRNIHCFFPSPPIPTVITEFMLKYRTVEKIKHQDKETLRKFNEKFFDHYEGEKLKQVKKLHSMSLQDWHEAFLLHILQYPHRIAFNLADFNLEHLTKEVVNSEITEYDFA